MSMPLNVALIGYGYAGRTIHAPLLHACPALCLHTIVSSKGEQLLHEHPGTRVLSDVTLALAATILLTKLVVERGGREVESLRGGGDGKAAGEQDCRKTQKHRSFSGE